MTGAAARVVEFEVICGWCPDALARTRAAQQAGREVTTAMCPTCTQTYEQLATKTHEFVGTRRLFQYSGRGAEILRELTGQRVMVLRELGDQEIDRLEVGPMFKVRFSDGTHAQVFMDELS